MSEQQAETVNSEVSDAISAATSYDERYLIFSLNGEKYGTPLLGVREIVELSPCKPIPYTEPYFLGVMNLRGEVVGLIDLRIKLGLEANNDDLMSVMVFDTPSGLLAALVDKVIAVSPIDEKEIDSKPNIQTKVQQDYILGVAKKDDELIVLIDLKNVLGADELLKIKAAR